MDHRVNQVEANEGVEHPKVVVGIPLSGGYQSGPYSRPGQRTAPQQVGSHRIQGPPEYQQAQGRKGQSQHRRGETGLPLLQSEHPPKHEQGWDRPRCESLIDG